MLFLLQMSDDMSEVGGENEGVPMSSASSISNDFASELPNVMSETEDSNSYLEPSSSETDSYMGTGVCFVCVCMFSAEETGVYMSVCMPACIHVCMHVRVCVCFLFLLVFRKYPAVMENFFPQ